MRSVREPVLRWWRELLMIGSFYLVYSWVRNQFGSAAVDSTVAYENAKRIVDLERAMGLAVEAEVQSWFITHTTFMQFWNVFYGTFHFAVTAFALVWLYLRFPADYPRWRTAGLITTGLALVGFALFPLMPPRLLGDCGVYGACVANAGYVDSLREVGGLWSFDSGPMQAVSNQYAAMPSLHFGWALMCFCILYKRIENPVGRTLAAMYPWATLFAIVVTANHYWIDAVGGAVVVLIGYSAASWLADRPCRRTSLARLTRLSAGQLVTQAASSCEPGSGRSTPPSIV